MKKVFILLVLTSLPLIACKKKGCTDSYATNYNSSAEKDDGSCSYPETNQEKIVGVWTGYQKITLIPGQPDEVNNTYSDIWEFLDAFNAKWNGNSGTYYFIDDQNIHVNVSNVNYKIFQLDAHQLTLETDHPAAGSIVPLGTKIRYYHNR